MRYVSYVVVVAIGLLTQCNKSAENDGIDANAAAEQSITIPGETFWKFQFGQKYNDVVPIAKSLKNSGYFDKLEKGSSGRSWLPEATKYLFAYGRGRKANTMDGILSSRCEGFMLLFKDDRLIGIEIMFAYKKGKDHVAKQTKAMERAFGLKASLKDEEDELGNVKRTIELDGSKIHVKMTDRLESDNAPRIKISAK